MVREVQLSWDSEQPYPAELEQSHWDSEDTILNDLPEVSHQKKRKIKPRGNATKLTGKVESEHTLDCPQ